MLGWRRHDSYPRTGYQNIAWWDAAADNYYLGHVAYASNYSGLGTITVTHMHNCKKTDPCVRTDTYNISEPGGFIGYEPDA